MRSRMEKSRSILLKSRWHIVLAAWTYLHNVFRPLCLKSKYEIRRDSYSSMLIALSLRACLSRTSCSKEVNAIDNEFHIAKGDDDTRLWEVFAR